MEKTVIEWLADKKIYEKQLKKIEEKLKSSPLYVAKHKLYANEKDMQEEVARTKALLDSYNQIAENKRKVEEALLVFNATHKIKVGDKEYTIASALKLYKNYPAFMLEYLRKQNNSKSDEIESLELEQQDQVERLSSELNASSKTISNQNVDDKIRRRRDDYEVVYVEAIKIEDEYTKLLQDKETFLENINTQINIANVKESLTINL